MEQSRVEVIANPIMQKLYSAGGVPGIGGEGSSVDIPKSETEAIALFGKLLWFITCHNYP